MIHRVLKNNQLNGTLDIGTSISDQLDLLDLQINYIEEFKPQIDVSKVKIMYAIIVWLFYFNRLFHYLDESISL